MENSDRGLFKKYFQPSESIISSAFRISFFSITLHLVSIYPHIFNLFPHQLCTRIHLLLFLRKTCCYQSFYILCQSQVWEMMPCYYLICFPLITSEAVHLFSSAICLSSTNYLLMSSFSFIWGYLSVFCWFIRLLYIVHISISYICNRYFFPTYI